MTAKKVDTWMPLLVDKYLGDTTHLTTEQHGAYLLLLMSMWKKDGRLQDNDQQLAQIAKCTPAKWRSMRPILIDGALLRSEDEWVMQKRLTAELAQAKVNTGKRSEAGAKGAAKRWQTDGKANGNANGEEDGKTDGKAMAKPMANAMADGMREHWQNDGTRPIPIAAVTPTEHTQPTEHASHAGSVRVEVVKALKRGGIDPMRVNLDDPRALALIAQGATPAEFEGLAREAIAKGIRQPFSWVLATLPARRADAAAIALAPAAPPPATTVPSKQADETQRYLAEQAAHQRSAPPRELFERIGKAVGKV